jgi:queuine tRNA-ribosyltransferase
VQGGMFADLRAASAQKIMELDFEGNAIGGLSVGESKQDMRKSLFATLPFLGPNKPRYLMGVGSPDDLFDGVLLGIDMFDCVMPTRNARNGTVFVRTSEDPSGKLHIKNAKHRFADEPLDKNCSCLACKNYSKGYLRHLFVSDELAVHRFLTLHSLTFLYDMMAELRSALSAENPWQDLLDVRRRYVGTAQNLTL